MPVSLLASLQRKAKSECSTQTGRGQNGHCVQHTAERNDHGVAQLSVPGLDSLPATRAWGQHGALLQVALPPLPSVRCSGRDTCHKAVNAASAEERLHALVIETPSVKARSPVKRDGW